MEKKWRQQPIVTAPGGKTWSYTYNALSQPTQVSIPNGMTTMYGYDGTNRLTNISHKDGANVLDGYAYTLDNAGNITATTQQDGAHWDYAYDSRYRLTSALRKNSGGATLTSYAYTYDNGDNMLSRTVSGTPTSFSYNNANELTSQTTGGVARAGLLHRDYIPRRCAPPPSQGGL